MNIHQPCVAVLFHYVLELCLVDMHQPCVAVRCRCAGYGSRPGPATDLHNDSRVARFDQTLCNERVTRTFPAQQLSPSDSLQIRSTVIYNVVAV